MLHPQSHLDLLQRRFRRQCTIIGSEGTLSWDYSDGVVEVRMADAARDRRWVCEDRRNDQFIQQLRHYLACLKGKERPLVDITDAARTLDVVLAAKASSAERRWITLDRR